MAQAKVPGIVTLDSGRRYIVAAGDAYPDNAGFEAKDAKHASHNHEITIPEPPAEDDDQAATDDAGAVTDSPAVDDQASSGPANTNEGNAPTETTEGTHPAAIDAGTGKKAKN